MDLHDAACDLVALDRCLPKTVSSVHRTARERGSSPGAAQLPDPWFAGDSPNTGKSRSDKWKVSEDEDPPAQPPRRFNEASH